MTRDEAIKYLRQIYPNGGHCWLDSQRIEAIEMATSVLSQPSLPSNLDEAAEEANKSGLIGFEGVCWLTKETPKHYFETGSEWMAGQGVTKVAVIGMATEEISINVSQQTLDELDLCPGDEVVVQIRKK